MKGEWDETVARRVTRAVVHEYIGFFKRFPDLGKQELYEELMPQVEAASDGFDAGVASQAKYVWTVAKRRLFNKLRDRERRHQWERVYASMRPGEVIDVVDPPRGPVETRVKLTGNEQREAERFAGEFDEQFEREVIVADNAGTPPLVEWLHEVYTRAKLLGAGRSQQGRRRFTAAQQVACGMLMLRLDLSCHGGVLLFKHRADLCRVMEWDSVPSFMFFSRAREVVKEILERSSGRRSGFGRSAVNSKGTVR